MKAERGAGSIDLYIFKLNARRGWLFNATPQPLYPRERDPVPIVQEAGLEGYGKSRPRRGSNP